MTYVQAIVTCEHLIALERALMDAGVRETFRGKAWSANSRECIYFNCVLSNESIRRQFKLADCVEDHDYFGTVDGAESGFVCSVHQDAIIALHPRMTHAAHRQFPE